MELLDGFGACNDPNERGPGVYHAPRVAAAEDRRTMLEKAGKDIPIERLWGNPDCGLKPRGWPETEAASRNMVAARALRQRQVGATAPA